MSSRGEKSPSTVHISSKEKIGYHFLDKAVYMIPSSIMMSNREPSTKLLQ
ncbi:hypothetical protein PIIN_11241 [Serendipita indica DSM 11827]|uniref:Uncharacterized protein n=1 Tax=Serendipita indica (strain DSM 11827) TaxID=1109443 RepID=G4U120_SERID|nr:hypothetical protein PIIN_11241 [Serendipita indica DSM 11827]